MLNAAAPDPAPALRGACLTERQVEILRCLGEGLSNKAIARRLNIAEKTVKGHVTTIFRALHVLNRTQAVVSARTAGIV